MLMLIFLFMFGQTLKLWIKSSKYNKAIDALRFIEVKLRQFLEFYVLDIIK